MPKAVKKTAFQTRAIAAWTMIHGYASLRIEGVLAAGQDEKTGEPREVAMMKAYLHGAILSRVSESLGE
ncbi:MAG: hypothetical protein F6K19_18710 [Cyanothece sp. SIO1E1]|nr:hypothetical protein [Cyanothece sp. SIO1E1]